MKITKFPMLCKAFALSDADNGNMHVLNRNFEVPKSLLKKFDIAERSLADLKGKTVRGLLGDSLNTETNKVTFEHLLNPGARRADDDAFENVALPVNDADETLLRANGCDEKTIETVRWVLNEYFDGELTERMHVETARLRAMRAKMLQPRPKIVVVLEVMWGMKGDKPARWFQINPYNHSGRRLIEIIGHGDFTVTNACPEIVYNANHRGKPSAKWLAGNLSRLQPQVVIVCGNVAQKTFKASMAPNAKVFKMPHPAARTWSKQSIAQWCKRIQRHTI